MNFTLVWAPGISLLELEREAIRQAMVYHRGIVTRVANSLGISRAGAYRKVASYFNEHEIEQFRSREPNKL